MINDQTEELIKPLTIKEFNQVIQEVEIDLISEDSNIDIDYYIQPQNLDSTNEPDTAELETRPPRYDTKYSNSNDTNEP